MFGSEQDLARAALCLGAAEVAGWSAEEQRLADAVAGVSEPAQTRAIRAAVQAGGDPLGEGLCCLRSAAQRRERGLTLTPWPVVASMLAWAAQRVTPARVVDAGMGTGRFLLAAGRRWPQARLVGVETDPLAAMAGRATLAAAGLAGRAQVELADYRTLRLPAVNGPTLFAGNPPYVRHHQVPAHWKDWLRASAAGLGLPASGLAGLHAHFFLATALHAVPGDVGVLVTAAEWLDVNYGALVRALLLGPLGGECVHVFDPTEPVFTDAMTTAAITCFLPGTCPPALRLALVTGLAGLGDLTGGAPVPRETLCGTTRWRPLVSSTQSRPAPVDGHGRHPAAGGRRRPPAGQVELGELCRVHRGQVTGANRVWVVSRGQADLPGRFVYPAVTRAHELFRAAAVLADAAGLRCVIDLPADLGELSAAEARQVSEFLARARAAGAADSYIARHRNPWWRVHLRSPAPILATYMARQPPAFVRNLAGARHVNIAHGLYPRDPLPPAALDALAAHLRDNVTLSQGRTYAGGLTKFEPGEMERLPVPCPSLLSSYDRRDSDPGVEPHAGQPRAVGDRLRGQDGVQVGEVGQHGQGVGACQART